MAVTPQCRGQCRRWPGGRVPSLRKTFFLVPAASPARPDPRRTLAFVSFRKQGETPSHRTLVNSDTRRSRLVRGAHTTQEKLCWQGSPTLGGPTGRLQSGEKVWRGLLVRRPPSLPGKGSRRAWRSLNPASWGLQLATVGSEDTTQDVKGLRTPGLPGAGVRVGTLMGKQQPEGEAGAGAGTSEHPGFP